MHGTLKLCVTVYITISIVVMVIIITITSLENEGNLWENMFVNYSAWVATVLVYRAVPQKPFYILLPSVLLLMSELPLKTPVFLTHLQPIQGSTFPSTLSLAPGVWLSLLYMLVSLRVHLANYNTILLRLPLKSPILYVLSLVKTKHSRRPGLAYMT